MINLLDVGELSGREMEYDPGCCYSFVQVIDLLHANGARDDPIDRSFTKPKQNDVDVSTSTSISTSTSLR